MSIPNFVCTVYTVEFVYNGFAYNVNLPTTSHFAWSRQNSYLLCTFRFAYNGIAYNVNSNTTAPFFISQSYFVRLQRHSRLEPFISRRNGRIQLSLQLSFVYSATSRFANSHLNKFYSLQLCFV